MNRRRSWIASVLLLSVIVTSGAPLSDPATREPESQTRDVQVVAHPDDDILFMNPDLASSIQSGHSSISIYLTGGESDLPHPATYAAQRQEGTRSSYARMAGTPNKWNRSAVAAAGRLIEVDELRARPDVKLVFLNLPEDNNPGQRHAPIRLWTDPKFATRSLITASGTVRQSYEYRRDDVINVLAALFERFRPTSLRLQDPQPDPRYQEGWVGFHNHPDHVIGARFAMAAARRYMANPRRGAPLLHYRDYNVADAPINLSAADRRRKKDYFSLYAQRDSEASFAGAYVDWSNRTYYRWPRGGSWAARDGAGRFHAFAVHGIWLQHWTGGPDGRWSAPRTSPVPEPLRPVLTTLPDPRGDVVLVAQSLDGRRILLRRQRDGHAWPERFTPVNAPAGIQVGTPSAVFDQRGRLLVATQVADRGVCVRAVEVERDWQCLGGRDVQDGVAAVLGADQRVHLFAWAPEGILHWQEDDSGGFDLVDRNLAGVRPAGPPTAVRVGDGIRVFARTAPDGAIADVGVDSGHPPRILPNPGGFTHPIVAGGKAVQVFARTSAGRLSAAGSTGSWTDLGGRLLDHPAALTGANGLVTLIALASDGRLLVNPQLPHAVVPTFGGWRVPFPQAPHAACREQRADCG